jgi:hypothetical protein
MSQNFRVVEPLTARFVSAFCPLEIVFGDIIITKQRKREAMFFFI